jgi:hypothetical protein
MDEIIKRHKSKLSSKLKLGEALMKNFEKYPNLIIKPIDESKQAQTCRVSRSFFQFMAVYTTFFSQSLTIE